MDGEDLVEDEVVLVSIIDKNDGKCTVLHVSKNSSINDILVMSGRYSVFVLFQLKF